LFSHSSMRTAEREAEYVIA